MLPKMRYAKLAENRGYKLSIDMFKNGFIHRVKVGVSRPYAEMLEGREDYLPFYDEDEAYIESDSDFEEVGGKRKEEERDEI
jgi:hypothetical protein